MSSTQDKIVEIFTSDLTYLPTPEQRKVKSALWARFAENPLGDPSGMSLASVQKLVNDRRIDRWWPVPGFRDWLLNREEFRERVEYLANLALDSLEGILANPEEKGMAKVNASKLLMEIARKMPPKHVKEIYSDKRIGEMDTKQLEEYIRRHTPMLVAADNPEGDK